MDAYSGVSIHIVTLTASKVKDDRDQYIIDLLQEEYSEVYYWVQGIEDYDYLHRFENVDNIKIVPPTKDAYHALLCMDDLDYVGTRLHAGVYAMRHRKRAIIIVIDERAREINKSNNLNCLEKDNIEELPMMINNTFETKIIMPFDRIEQWKKQFK